MGDRHREVWHTIGGGESITLAPVAVRVVVSVVPPTGAVAY